MTLVRRAALAAFYVAGTSAWVELMYLMWEGNAK